ncbi:choline transporter-like protein 4 [Petromyzon marinus]|uniref:Choline transporter-like protein n=1 Tax=Petromyzon marinus TaxID=7757 RepID=A0AAJ7UBL1_PETMA|nr:choline transporter-like protein 4 [Petromyzon marinus]XP_032832231.1 choline transporter-like protein 4 [Petromyzon marinus]
MGGKKSTPQSSSPHGEPNKHDPSFKGPVSKRGCTDIICCVLFILVIAGYIIVGILAWLNGDPRKVLYPVDSAGRFCGIGPMSDKPYLFYMDILKCATSAVTLTMQCPTTQICVKTCPSEFWVPSSISITPADVFRQEYCSINLTTTSKNPIQIMEDGECAYYLVASDPFLNRCFPRLVTNSSVVYVGNDSSININNNAVSADKFLSASKGVVGLLDARQVGMRVFEDFAKSWHWILIGLAIAMVVSLLFLLLLRFTAPVLIWVIIIGVLVAGAYGIFHCSWEFVNLSGKPGADQTVTNLGVQTDFRIYLQLQQTWLAFIIILCIVEFVILLMLIFLRKRILIAIALIQEASRAIGHIMSSIFYPVLTFLLLSVCIAYWGVTALYLATAGTATYKVASVGNHSSPGCNNWNTNTTACTPGDGQQWNTTECPDAQCVFATYGLNDSLFKRNLFNLQIYNVFAFLWLVNFVLALGECSLAGAFGSYYWTLDKRDLPALPVTRSFMRAVRYHTGSLAFGALIITIIQMIRILLEYLDHKLKGSQNRFLKFLLCCLKCCFWCLEKIMKFINRNAYIMVAIYGKNFCVSAKNAFKLIMRNILRTLVLDKVTDFLLLLGKLLVVGGVGILAFFFFSDRIKIPNLMLPTLNYYWIPILTVVLGSYLIAHGFFSVYTMCVDTLFLCFLDDLERNDGSAEKPYYMSKKLLKILNKKNKKNKAK